MNLVIYKALESWGVSKGLLTPVEFLNQPFISG